ncbi:MAG: hypothetical protein HC876_23230 [Chloroflexaceae bacterium]|nr:hypothetical protein [Chloroflexaceae bacterium]
MSNQHEQLAALRHLRATTTDPTQRAALDAAIQILESAPTPPASATQAATESQQVAQAAMHSHARQATVSASAPTGVVNQGDIGRNLFTGTVQSNNIAEVINIYKQTTTTPDVDYGKALQQYLEYLYIQNSRIDLRGIDDRPMDMPLRELYVSLSLHEPPPGELRGRGGLRRWIAALADRLTTNDPSPAPTASAFTLPESPSMEPVDWSQVLRHPQVVVVGAPGSGKTTLLHYTAVRLAEILAHDTNQQLASLGLDDWYRDWQGRPPIPILLAAARVGDLPPTHVSRQRLIHPRILLECILHYYNGFDLNLPTDFFQRLCKAGRAMLLLDGLDEVPRSDDRILVSAMVREFAMRYPACRYVVTSRTAAYEGDARIGASFRICTVAEMRPQQQQQFYPQLESQPASADVSGQCSGARTRYEAICAGVVARAPPEPTGTCSRHQSAAPDRGCGDLLQQLCAARRSRLVV